MTLADRTNECGKRLRSDDGGRKFSTGQYVDPHCDWFLGCYWRTTQNLHPTSVSSYYDCSVAVISCIFPHQKSIMPVFILYLYHIKFIIYNVILHSLFARIMQISIKNGHLFFNPVVSSITMCEVQVRFSCSYHW